MRYKTIDGLFWVVTENNELRVYNPDGQPVKGEIFCRVTDHIDCFPEAIFKVIVNIAGSREEMMQKIKEFNGGK